MSLEKERKKKKNSKNLPAFSFSGIVEMLWKKKKYIINKEVKLSNKEQKIKEDLI